MPSLVDSHDTHAIAMWDFSWLERRWSGAGYEDWTRALEDLVERGYDVVRIDAFPHLIWAHEAEYVLVPVWDQHPWGSPATVRVDPLHGLIEFLALAREKHVRVSLSTWFREDTLDVRSRLTSPELLAAAWIATLEHIAASGLLDVLWFVDLCNEWPQPMWAPFVSPDGSTEALLRTSTEYQRWTDTALSLVRKRFPTLPLCFSFTDQMLTWEHQDVRQFDLLELHCWMVHGEAPSFYDTLGYDIVAASFDPHQYDVLKGAPALYRSDESLWKSQLDAEIHRAADWSRRSGLPLVTTESWATVCWKDGDGLEWTWVKDLCAHGVDTALDTRRWAAMSTSNFCGPQFPGMWDDVEWHRSLTRRIRSTPHELS